MRGTIAVIIGCGLALATPASGQRVTIYRDTWGVPHVYADREEDGFYGLGYAQAADRLEPMLFSWLRAAGGLASAEGTRFVDADFDQLRFRHLTEARLGLRRLPPQLAKNYTAFVAGVSRFMKDHPDKVPDWAPVLEPALPLAAFRSFIWSRLLFDGVVYWSRQTPRDGKCSRAGTPRVNLAQGPAMSSGNLVGSNAWVLMPWRTADNAVIHLGDPHGGLSAIWEFRLDAGSIKVAGATLAGIALPFTGHTRDIAWAFSLFGTDGFDCYIVLTDPKHPRRYRYDGEWRTMITRTGTVQVKGGLPITRTLEYTRHNGVLSPVVRRSADTAFVLSLPDMEQPGHYDRQFYGVARARSMAEFKAAIFPGFISANVMAGSSDGHTFYVRGGYVPRRGPEVDWTRPLAGNTSATAWRGMHTLDDLVTIEDPPAGYMSNNNISPDMMMERGNPDLGSFPGYLYDDAPGRTNSRGIRAIEILSRAYAVTADDALALAEDDRWVFTDRWLEALRRAANAAPEWSRAVPADQRRFVGLLLGFDGFARPESEAALGYWYWWHALRADTARFRRARATVESGAPLPPDHDRWLRAGVDSAYQAITRRHGRVGVALGEEFRAGRGGISVPVGGAGLQGLSPFDGVAVLKALAFTPIDSTNRRWAAAGGYHTTLTIFTKPIQSWSLAPLGQSQDSTSPHHSDQARFLSQRRLKPTLFYKEDLLKVNPTSLVLDRLTP